MIILKNDIDLLGMKVAAKIASDSLRVAKKIISEGITAKDIDDAVRDFIFSRGGTPSFLGYITDNQTYHFATCVSINHEVVHGLPLESKVLKSPMLIKVDVGVEYDGYHADTAWTFALGNIPWRALILMRATKEALYRSIDVCKKRKKVSQITRSIYLTAKKYGFNPAKGVTGHGIGLELHEDPVIFNHPDDVDKDYTIKVGMGLYVHDEGPEILTEDIDVKD